MPPALNPRLEMVAIDGFPLREPVSMRTYTCLRVRTRSGATGYGECSRISPSDLARLRAAIQGREASSFESIRRGLSGGAGCAGRAGHGDARPGRQVHQCTGLSGAWRAHAQPGTRTGADRRGTDEALVAAVLQAHAAGHKAFLIPVPATRSPNHSATLVNATQQRLDRVRSAAGAGSDFVVDAAGNLDSG